MILLKLSLRAEATKLVLALETATSGVLKGDARKLDIAVSKDRFGDEELLRFGVRSSWTKESRRGTAGEVSF